MVHLQILSDEGGTQEEAVSLSRRRVHLLSECRDYAGRNWLSRQAQPNSYCHSSAPDRAKVFGVPMREDALEIQAKDGAKIILIFKTPPELPEIGV